MGVVSWNSLDANMTTDVTKHHTESPLFFVFAIAYFVSAMGNVLGFFVLMKCKKLPLQIKVLSINMIVPDFLLGSATGIAYGIQYVYPLSTGGAAICHAIFDTLTTLSILNITAFGVDRFLSLKFALKYQIYTTKERMIAMCVIMWLFSITSAVMIQLLKSNKALLFKIIIRSVFLSIYVFSYLMILHMYRIHNKKINDLQSLSASRIIHDQMIFSRKIVLITGPHFVLYILAIIIHVIMCFATDIPIWHMEMVVLGITVTTIFINPILYIWRFRECRIQLLLMICICNRTRREKLLTERNILYQPFLEVQPKETSDKTQVISTHM
ncbi:melanocortin receptor 5-like [Crassostrea angulata]|uniref:melanocortin receptor 5-like n=1 Tax=Magallana angulata TaxID=2784310 RepID=UPI0022B21974|nr:melanocortin receptor 5-like [Crassostrea angulata]